MKQVLQQPSTGEISVAEVPAPQLLPGCVLVRIGASLVSAGTERASAEFARKSLVQKAQARPDLVRDVINKVRRDGILSAVQAVRSRLDQPSMLGYSSAGTVTGVGEGVVDIRVGDRVACAGAGYAVHAEVACVPRMLVAKIPEGAPISLDEAAFTTLGAVALHGIRTAEAKLGDVVAVLGLGLVGQLTAQLLKAAGCRVLGFDIAADRVNLAIQLGIDAASDSTSEFSDLVSQYTRGFGVDAVLITAETPSSEPVNQAAQVARDRAIVVAVGTVGMELERQHYYEKELDFRISRSYGPGRYDAAFEQKGRDYPIGQVRWTETRNMEGFLQFLADGKLDLKPLITHRFGIDQAKEAYDIISGSTRERSLGVLFTYPESSNPSQRVHLTLQVIAPVATPGDTLMRVGLLGAGNFATSTLLPALREATGAELVEVCAATGAHSRHAAEKFTFQSCTTNEGDVLNNERVNTVVIATRHHLHASQVLAARAAGKHIFCEKPLCLNEGDLMDIVRACEPASHTRGPLLMLGFNRRFSPMALRMKEFLAIKEPLALHYRVNAGALPPDHWINDPEVGGGRIVGEVCHFIDFLSFLAGALPIEVQARALANPGLYSDDNVLISLRFENGSEGTIHYLANGDRAFSKERVEVFGGGAVAVLDDFRKLEMTRFGKKSTMSARWRQDKGHRGEWQAFADALRTGAPAPIPFESIVSTTLTTFCIQKSRASGQSVIVDTRAFMQTALRNDSQN
jgi:predicted dehydrogenase/threonine dehydrogenase-like Zn-dependent dehydrogenase